MGEYKMNICEMFGKNVYVYRQEEKMTQEQLAELAGLHRTYISAVERGVRSISLKNIEKIATALKIPVYKLFEFEEEDNE